MDLQDFDWQAGPNYPFTPRQIISSWDVAVMGLQETSFDRKLRMLRQLSNTCSACTMCELGRKEPERNGVVRDPHVFSNMNPQRIVVCGQGPGWEEITKGTPFIGQSGSNFDKELTKYGLSRSDFYITNSVRCFINDNAKPNYEQLRRCRPFLEIEIHLIRPYFVITLGACAFEAFCAGENYNASLGTLCYSKSFDVKVFPVYHPSPLNLADCNRKQAFIKQMQLACGLVNRLKQSKLAGDLQQT